MTAKIIDGLAIAKRLRADYRTQVDRLVRRGVRPGLAVVLVGEHPASQVYVRNKIRACEDVGIHSETRIFPADVAQEAVLDHIQNLNDDPAIHGILVQLPLPAHFDSRAVLTAVSAAKDVDGFHPQNLGLLAMGLSPFPPCTPAGILKMLEFECVPIYGCNAAVVGASNIVGKPMALLLLQQGATVTICNSKTRNLAEHTIAADILVVATGRPGLVTGEMVRKGAVVIDVGMSRLADGRLVGDVVFEKARERAALITPVPGGVGPMTVTMLLKNTIDAARREHGAL